MTILRVDTIAGTGTTFGPLLDGNLEFNSQNYIVLPKGSSNQQGVLRTTEDVIGVGGTYYDNLVLAMPFNEATGLRDVSSRNRNPGAYGNVSISSTISKYYGSSAYFDGTGDYIGISSTKDIVFGLGDFTIEGWFYLNGTGQQHIFENRGGTNTNTILINIDASTQLAAFLNGSYRITGSALSTGTWYHFAFVRSGGTSTLYQNGSSLGTYADSINYAAPQGGNAYIGVDDGPSGSYLNGHLQDLRIYKGIAKYTANFTPPERIAETGVGFKTGALRYNTDSNKPELYDGNQWTELQISNVGLGTDGDTGPGARGLVFGGQTPANITGIDAFNISSTGSAFEFGDLSAHSRYTGSTSSSTLAVTAGGANAVTTIDRTVFSSQGTSTNYGNLSAGRYGLGAVSNGTRAVFIGGFIAPSPSSPQDTMDYITISSGGTAQSFETLTDSKNYMGACESKVRGVFAGGTPVASPYTPLTSDIEFITTATLGKEQDFGNLSTQISGMSGLSNATRGIFAGGYINPGTTTAINGIEYVTLSTRSNSVNFGDLTVSSGGYSPNAGSSSPTRGVFLVIGTVSSNMDMVNINTEGNSVDFGDLFEARTVASGTSNAHGGL